jgi:hypothetical protein
LHHLREIAISLIDTSLPLGVAHVASSLAAFDLDAGVKGAPGGDRVQAPEILNLNKLATRLEKLLEDLRRSNEALIQA